MAFCDSDNFKFVEVDVAGSGSDYTSGKHLIPVHYRELGSKDKDGHTYSKKVSWSDVVINEVPLEQTFQYEDHIAYLEDVSHATYPTEDRGVIVVNERSSHLPTDHANYDDSNDYDGYGEQWLHRMNKLGLQPFNLPEAKKKKKSQGKYPVKPKDKKAVRDEKIKKSSELFGEIVDKKEHGVLGEHIFQIPYTFYEEVDCWDDGDEFGNNVRNHPLMRATLKFKTYCPPEHWLYPVKRWDLIWSEMDLIEHGVKRSYHYVEPGNVNKDGVKGPAIYFYDEDSDDMNYNFNENYDFTDGSPPEPFLSRGILWKKTKCSITGEACLNRSQDAFMNDPTESNWDTYDRVWGLRDRSSARHCRQLNPDGRHKRDKTVAPFPHL